jgi:type III secretory pathway component EscR
VNQIKEHIIFKALALSLALIVLAPVAVKFAHVFSHHNHKVCQDNSTTHFHEIDVDCNFYKFKLNNNTPLVFTDYDFFIPKKEHSEIISHYFFLSKYQQLHVSLRGPPALV